MNVHFLLLCGMYVLLSTCIKQCDATSSVTVVDLTQTTNGTNVAVNAAAGLMNRGASTVYTLQQSYDQLWQTRLLPDVTFIYVAAADFLDAAVQSYPVIVYNATELFSLPAVMTLAGVLNAIPIDQDMWAGPYSNATVVFVAAGAWGTQLESIMFVSDLALNQTTTVAFQRPTDLVQGLLVDYIVGSRLFVQYMTDGCIVGTQEHTLLKSIVDKAPWPRPIRVYGYNGLDVFFGGDLFEAETDCVNSMGQVATEQARNLQFWTNVKPIRPNETMQQRPAEPITYSPSKAYVALVYGDMDNIDFVQTFGSDHMEYRSQQCSTPDNVSRCFPLTWTLSPNLIQFSPQMMRWYFSQAYATGRDWIIMPPSGTLYSYPGMMSNDTQVQYVIDQSAQASIMNTSGSVHWEWFFAWDGAWDVYFPRYTDIPPEASTTRAFFLNDVPWPLPIPDMWLRGETYRFVGNASDPSSVVGFRPAFNWQEGSPGGGNPGNASAIAAMVNALPLGTVQYVYVIQNTDVAHLFDMVTMLEDHVELVGYEQLVSLARQRETR